MITINLAITQRNQLEESKGLLCSLKTGDVLQYRLGLTVLRNDEWLTLLAQFGKNLCCICLQVANWFDLGRKALGTNS